MHSGYKTTSINTVVISGCGIYSYILNSASMSLCVLENYCHGWEFDLWLSQTVSALTEPHNTSDRTLSLIFRRFLSFM